MKNYPKALLERVLSVNQLHDPWAYEPPKDDSGGIKPKDIAAELKKPLKIADVPREFRLSPEAKANLEDEIVKAVRSRVKVVPSNEFMYQRKRVEEGLDAGMELVVPVEDRWHESQRNNPQLVEKLNMTCISTLKKSLRKLKKPDTNREGFPVVKLKKLGAKPSILLEEKVPDLIL